MSKAKKPASRKRAVKSKAPVKAVSSKTPQVMRLVEKEPEANPVILTGKALFRGRFAEESRFQR